MKLNSALEHVWLLESVADPDTAMSTVAPSSQVPPIVRIGSPEVIAVPVVPAGRTRVDGVTITGASGAVESISSECGVE